VKPIGARHSGPQRAACNEIVEYLKRLENSAALRPGVPRSIGVPAGVRCDIYRVAVSVMERMATCYGGFDELNAMSQSQRTNK
jgi:hypothetical protein